MTNEALAAYHPLMKDEPCDGSCSTKHPEADPERKSMGQMHVFGTCLPKVIVNEAVMGMKKDSGKKWRAAKTNTILGLFKSHANNDMDEIELRRNVKQLIGLDIVSIASNQAMRRLSIPWVFCIRADDKGDKLTECLKEMGMVWDGKTRILVPVEWITKFQKVIFCW